MLEPQFCFQDSKKPDRRISSHQSGYLFAVVCSRLFEKA
jgi:hypothetical protein